MSATQLSQNERGKLSGAAFPPYSEKSLVKFVIFLGTIVGGVISVLVFCWGIFMIAKCYGRERMILNPWSVLGAAPETPVPPIETDPLLESIPEVAEGKFEFLNMSKISNRILSLAKGPRNFLSIIGSFTPTASPWQSESDLTVTESYYGTPTSTFSIDTFASIASTETLK